MNSVTPKKVVILGGRGNGSVIAQAIVDANVRGSREWEMAGYLNDREEVGSELEGFPILGKLTDWKSLSEDHFFINTIFRIDGQQQRIGLVESLGIPDDRWATFVHPLAYVAPNVQLGPGCVVMPYVTMSAGSKLGRNCLMMVSCTIGHNNQIGDNCHFAAQCCVGAYLKIEDGVHVGLNATIKEDLVLQKYSTLGMGAVLTKSMGEGEIWVGNPAKLLRKAE